MRATIATPTFGAKAMTSWPTAMSSMPATMIGREP
jgi:hypothetical protein